MMLTLIVGGVAAWVLLSIVAALLLGRTVRVADRRRPHTVRRRRGAAAAFGRVVELATGSIPVIGPRLAAMTGAIPVIRPRVD